MKKLFCTLCLIFSFMCLNHIVCYATMQDDFPKILEQIEINNDLNKAEMLAIGYITKYPKYSDGYTILGRIYNEKNEAQKAIDMYTKALSVNNFYYAKKSFAYMARAGLYWDYKNNLQLALKDYDNAILNTSDKYELCKSYSYRGELKTFLNSPASAQTDLEKALSYDIISGNKALHASDLAYLSKALYMQKKYEDSIKKAHEALQICGVSYHKTSIIAQIYMAKSAFMTKEYDLAKNMAELAKGFLETNGKQSNPYYSDAVNILRQINTK